MGSYGGVQGPQFHPREAQSGTMGGALELGDKWDPGPAATSQLGLGPCVQLCGDWGSLRRTPQETGQTCMSRDRSTLIGSAWTQLL